jgi:hypothetical protein
MGWELPAWSPTEIISRIYHILRHYSIFCRYYVPCVQCGNDIIRLLAIKTDGVPEFAGLRVPPYLLCPWGKSTMTASPVVLTDTSLSRASTAVLARKPTSATVQALAGNAVNDHGCGDLQAEIMSADRTPFKLNQPVAIAGFVTARRQSKWGSHAGVRPPQFDITPLGPAAKQALQLTQQSCVPCHGRRRPAIHDFCAVRRRDVDGAPARTMTCGGRCVPQVIRLFCLGP